MQSCLYEGRVRHRRFIRAANQFTYSLYMVYVDLAELPGLFDGRWLWSARGRNLAEFRRADYHGPADVQLDQAVRHTVAVATGRRPTGPIRLLTHLRYFGYIFNPVSFYYIHDDSGQRVETIMAEITNTPWGERRAHVLSRDHNLDADRPGRHRFQFRKDFHVSPFLGMDYDYDWRFSDPGRSLGVHMENRREGRRDFDATMTLRRVEMTSSSLARVLLNYPAMTATVVAGIYWQAARLWFKGAPFHDHPHTTHPTKRINGSEEAIRPQ